MHNPLRTTTGPYELARSGAEHQVVRFSSVHKVTVGKMKSEMRVQTEDIITLRDVIYKPFLNHTTNVCTTSYIKKTY